MIVKHWPLLWIQERNGQAGVRNVRVWVDQGDHGHTQVGSTTVSIPGKKVHANAYALRRHQTLCERHSAIEAMIIHLKSAYRLGRNDLKGNVGDTDNAL
jgi:transposase, IS5 family